MVVQAMGYPIPERRPAPSKPHQQPAPTPPAPRQPGAAAPAPTAAAAGGPRSALGQPLSRPSSFSVQVRGAQQGPRQQEPVLRAAASAVATPRPAFEDIAVPEPAAALRGNAVGSTALNGYPAPAATLITGTELAAVEAPRTRPVKVGGHDSKLPSCRRKLELDCAGRRWATPLHGSSGMVLWCRLRGTAVVCTSGWSVPAALCQATHKQAHLLPTCRYIAPATMTGSPLCRQQLLLVLQQT